MTNPSVTTPAPQEASRYLPLLLILFAASGCSALIYEIVWYQLLQLAIGSTAVSLGFLLATFMGGLCLGSLGLPRLRAAPDSIRCASTPRSNWASASSALLVLWCLPLIDRVYIAGAEHGLPGMLLRGFIAAVCLLPPTILMGASLPAIVALDRSPRRAASRGGACSTAAIPWARSSAACSPASTCCASTTWPSPPTAAAAINLAVALVSFWLAARTPAEASVRRNSPSRRRGRRAAPTTPIAALADLRHHRPLRRHARWAPKWSGRA